VTTDSSDHQAKLLLLFFKGSAAQLLLHSSW